MRYAMILCLGLGVATAAVYLQTGDHGFITFDDPGHVTENPRVQGGGAGGGVKGEKAEWALIATAMSNWHPLTWLSHMLDVQLFGLDPRGHHLASVVLHALNAVLLFLALDRMTGATGKSAAVAA